MKISSISDLHIKLTDDKAHQTLVKFFRDERVVKSDMIILLGDIFDLMCGDHSEYLLRFPIIFKEIKNACIRGTRVLYFEGNHDLHLKKIFDKLFSQEKKEIKEKFEIVTKSLVLEVHGKNILISHGDEYDIGNTSYQKYKKFVTGRGIEFFANNIMPLKLLDFLGTRASKISRKQGSKKFVEEEVREKIRNGVKILNHGENIILGGHSHVKDMFQVNENQCYLNNGLPIRDNVFIFCNDGKWSMENL